MKNVSTAIQDRITTAESALSLDQLEALARQRYESSLSERIASEHTAQYRAEARRMALKMLDQAPDHAPALNLLGRIALDEGFYENAERYLQDAVTQTPGDAGCWYSLGHVALARGDYDDAVRHFTRSLDIAPGETRAATSLVYTFACQGNVVQAFQGYRKLIRVHPGDQHVRAKLFDVAQHIQADHYQPDLEAEVIEWLAMDNVDHDGLAPLAASLLRHKYRIDDSDSVIDLQDLSQDTLLCQSLERLYFSQPYLEPFLILVRKQLLLNSLAGYCEDEALLRLASRFCMQGAHNEYVYEIDEEEASFLVGLKDLLETVLTSDQINPDDCLPALLLYGMYEPPHELPNSHRLARKPLKTWPEWVQPVIKHTLYSRQTEAELARTLKPLKPISNPVSRTVQQQYEENPYPRWLHLGYSAPTNYGRALESELAGFRAPQFFNMGTLNVLIAGCGTGKHALRVAKYFRNVQVTAVDLSRRSLAYAKKMARRYRIKNIDFYHGDLLDLPSLNQSFHVIECSGVLHHMDSPAAGLAALQNCLLPNGVMKIGLYSERARHTVVHARQWIEDFRYQPSRPDIRRFRNHVLTDRLEGDFSALLESRDFYSTSGCRDLLFHCQEHRFTLTQIDQMLADQALAFLGFVLPRSVRRAFKATYPDQPLNNLEAWDRFEADHPSTFAGMYQFYVQQT